MSLNLSSGHTMKKNPDNLRYTAHAGFSLVEIMVAMIIALLGMIIMFQVFSVSEDVRRTTTSGGDAMQNGASSLFVLERSLKYAGYGIFASTNIPPLPADAFNTNRVLITPGGANTSDTIAVTYREGWDFGPFPPDPFAYALAVPPALTIETFSVSAAGDLMSSKAYDTAVAYAIAAPPAVVAGVVISEGIALMKADYGIDTNNDGRADTWNQGPPPTVQSVKAIRVAVVARSAQPERPPVAGAACNTTTVFPTWSGSVALDLTAEVGLDAATDDWMCYRYKTFENVVPLRN